MTGEGEKSGEYEKRVQEKRDYKKSREREERSKYKNRGMKKYMARGKIRRKSGERKKRSK